MADPNSISYWFPKLKRSGVPVPRTRLVKAPPDLPNLLYEEPVGDFDGFLDRLLRAVHAIGYPCFLRTGHLSGKHGWNRCCYVDNPLQLSRHVYNLVEASALAGILGLPTDIFAVREFLPIRGDDPDFDDIFIAFRGLPIRRERRVFIADGKVVADMSYWPEDAIQAWGDIVLPDDWRERLARLNMFSRRDDVHLIESSRQVAQHFQGAWSLDWLWDGKRWVAIDMAQAHMSWGCPDELQHDKGA